MKSYLKHLECTYCGLIHSVHEPNRLCVDCGKVLYPRYDIEKARLEVNKENLKVRDSNMWRYFEILPVKDESNIVSVRVVPGDTPQQVVEKILDQVHQSPVNFYEFPCHSKENYEFSTY